MVIVGLDGCKSGWIKSTLTENKINGTVSLHIERIESVYDLLKTPFSFCFVDIPIGLSSPLYTRKLDNELRKLLSSRKKSSVFTPPCRAALYAENYTEAKRINILETGKSISIQAWNIGSKIREVEWFVKQYPTLSIYESHPELCFEKLNRNIPLLHSKKTAAGKTERLQLLVNLFPIIENTLFNFKKNNATFTEDMLDSVCLAVMGYFGAKHSFSTVLPNLERDEQHIWMNAYYFEFG